MLLRVSHLLSESEYVGNSCDSSIGVVHLPRVQGAVHRPGDVADGGPGVESRPERRCRGASQEIGHEGADITEHYLK